MQLRASRRAWPLVLSISSLNLLLCTLAVAEPRFKALVPGSDYTLQCRPKTQGVKVKWFYKKQPNVKELWHEEQAYVIIVHFTKVNEGVYACKSNGHTLVSATLLLKSSTMEDQVTIYRPIGVNTTFLLFCKRLSVAKEATWIWLPYQAKGSLQIQAHDAERGTASEFQEWFGDRLVAQVNRKSGFLFNLNISPVHFEDAGIYMCEVYGWCITYKLITVKVNKEVSESLTGGSCSITCSVSYNTNNIVLVWTKNNGSHLETLNVKQLSTTDTESKLKLHVRCGEALHVTCLVFDRQSLVAFMSLQQETMGPPSTTSASEETTLSSTTNNTDSVIVTEFRGLPSISITTNEQTGEEGSLIPAATITCSVVFSSIITICGALIFKLYKGKRRDSSDVEFSSDELAVNNCTRLPETKDQVIYASLTPDY